MYKYVLSIITAVLPTLDLPAQELTFKRGPDYREEIKGDSVISFYTTPQELTGVIRDSKKHLIYEIFDKNLSQINSSPIERNRKEIILGDLYFEDEIKVFTELTEGKNKRTLFCHIFNLADRSHHITKLYETILEGRNTLYSEMKNHQVLFAQSEDGKFLVMATDHLDKDDDSYLIRVFNSRTLHQIYETTFINPPEKYFELQDLVIDNNGEVYSLGKQYLENHKERVKGSPKFSFILNKINRNEVHNLHITLDSLHVRSLSMLLKANEVQLLGLYSEKGDSHVKGGCTIIVDRSSLVITENYHESLPMEVFNDIYGAEKAEKQNDKELDNFNIDYLRKDALGNVYLLAERLYYTHRGGLFVPGGIGFGSVGEQVPHFDEILVLKFEQSGKLKWARSLFKKSYEHSYNAFINDGQLHVILNAGKDLKEKKDGRLKITNDFFESKALYDFSFTENGERKVTKILDYEDKERYMPNLGSYQGNQFIMSSSGGKTKHFAILK
jgi:hypothetical protein